MARASPESLATFWGPPLCARPLLGVPRQIGKICLGLSRGQLEGALGRLAHRWRARTPPGPQISLSPGCAYGVRYAQLLEDLQKDVAEVKARLNGLLFLLAGTVALEIVFRLVR